MKGRLLGAAVAAAAVSALGFGAMGGRVAEAGVLDGLWHDIFGLRQWRGDR